MNINQIIKSTATYSASKMAVLNLVVTEKVLSERIANLLKTFDLSTEQFNVLRILRGQKGKPANMFLIQERMLAKTSNTTRLVDKLLTKGLVTRNVCPNNRRKMEIGITESGLELLDKMDPVIEGFENSLQEVFSEEELINLNRILEKLRCFISTNSTK